jgi:hypothetical protein
VLASQKIGNRRWSLQSFWSRAWSALSGQVLRPITSQPQAAGPAQVLVDSLMGPGFERVGGLEWSCSDR